MHYYVGGRIMLKQELALKFKILCGDKDYKLTVSDIKLLKNTLKGDCSYKTRKTINEILYREDVSFDSKILKEFLKVDFNKDDYINNFVFYSDVKNMIKRTGYNLQEKMELKILEDIDVSYYSLIGYVKINSIPVEEKIAFIEKWASLGMNVNKNFIYCVFNDEILNNALLRKDEKVLDVIEAYNLYRENNSNPNFDEFCNNVMKKNYDFSTFKYQDLEPCFTKEMFLYMVKGDCLAPYYELFNRSSVIKDVLFKDKGEDDLFASDATNLYLPMVKQLEICQNYNLNTFMLKYLKEAEYDDFTSFVMDLKATDEKSFNNIFNNEKRDEISKERLVCEAKDYFKELSLKEFTKKAINDYYLGLKAPNSEEFLIGKTELASLANKIYRNKLRDRYFVEVKKFRDLLYRKEDIISYIDTQDYTCRQALAFVKMVRVGEFPFNLVKALENNLNLEIKKRDAVLKKETEHEMAHILMTKFMDESVTDLGSFQKNIMDLYNIDAKEQLKLLNLACSFNNDVSVGYLRKLNKILKPVAKSEEVAPKDEVSEEIKVLNDYKARVCKIMNIFNKTPNVEIARFCENIGFDVNSLDIKDMDMIKLFFEKAKKVPLEVAQKMTLCEDKDVIYNLYEHFLEYGITPKKTAVIAKTLSMEKENMVINNYIYNHSLVFAYIPYSKIETMERGSSLYDAYYRLENDCVSYDRKSLLKAFDDLTDNHIPLCRGTLFEALKKYGKSGKILSKKDNKGSC